MEFLAKLERAVLKKILFITIINVSTYSTLGMGEIHRRSLRCAVAHVRLSH